LFGGSSAVSPTSQEDLPGRAVSSGGDFNGDGFADLLVGAPGYSLGDGIGYILFGKASGFQATQNLGELDGTDGIRFTADNRDNIS